MTTADALMLWANIDCIGILSSKSISKEPIPGFPSPNIEQVTEWHFRNRMGLPNPGVDEFVSEIKDWKVPSDKFFLVSIFGKTYDEFKYVAKKVAPYADGIEINESCPHTGDKSGAFFGSSPELTKKVVRAVRMAVDIPIFTKLTPNVDNIAKIAEAALAAGSDGISLINTTGPESSNVLHGGMGGASGRAIYRTLFQKLQEITPVVKKYEAKRGKPVPVIAMGGIYCSADMLELKEVGPEKLFFGIGTALFDKNHHEQKKFLEEICDKYEKGIKDYSVTAGQAKTRLMKYKDVTIQNIIEISGELRAYQFKEVINFEPGNFVMLWIPGVSEKPFSIAHNWPFTIVVKKHNKKNNFTSALWELKKRDKIRVRGPHGNSFPLVPSSYDLKHVIVAGGVGAAPLYKLASYLSNKSRVEVLMGARNSKELLTDISTDLSFKDLGNVIEITDNGSSGRKGLVTDLLEEFLEKNNQKFNLYTCGPEVMMKKALDIASKDPNFNQGYASVERYMKCGMGGCGSCDMDGKTTCKDGPVRSWEVLKDSKDFGFYKRDAAGRKVKI